MNRWNHEINIYLRELTLAFINSRLVPRALRSRAWRAIGHDIHPTALMNHGTFLGDRSGLTVGAETFINVGCFFDLSAPTTIGARCDIGYQVMFVTASHEVGTTDRRAGQHAPLPIVIGDGVWIGARATILPGTTIPSGCVVAAGSVVRGQLEPQSLWAGVPARLVRRFVDDAG